MIGEPVDVIRTGSQTGVDEYNQPVHGAAVEHTERGAAFAPAGSVVRVAVGRYTAIEKDTLYFNRRGVDIIVGDRVRVRGVVRLLDGVPERWVNPFDGREVGVTVALKAVSG